jgi:hypothetical protein
MTHLGWNLFPAPHSVHTTPPPSWPPFRLNSAESLLLENASKQDFILHRTHGHAPPQDGQFQHSRDSIAAQARLIRPQRRWAWSRGREHCRLCGEVWSVGNGLHYARVSKACTVNRGIPWAGPKNRRFRRFFGSVIRPPPKTSKTKLKF